MKKVYIPIGLCILAVLVVGFLSLRPQPPQEPLKIFKATTAKSKTTAKVSETQQKEISTSDEAAGGHFHEDGTWHADEVLTMPRTSENASNAPQEYSVKVGNNTAGGVPLLEDPEPLEDPVLVELHAERLELKQRQKEDTIMVNDFLAAIEGDKLTMSEFLKTAEELHIRSVNLLKEQAEWRRKYVEYTGTEYPGTSHWVEHAEEDPETLRKLFEQEMRSRGYHIVDP